MVEDLPENSLLIFDRGYPSYELIKYYIENFNGELLIRGKKSSTFKVISDFMEGSSDDEIVSFNPTSRYIKKYGKGNAKAIKVRLIRMKNSKGEESPIITTLLDSKRYPAQILTKLYWKRWGSETAYRHEKSSGKIENWHSKTSNGVLQELFSFQILHAISSLLIRISRKTRKNRFAKPVIKEVLKQTKNIVVLFVTYKKKLLYKMLKNLFYAINSYLYYPPKVKRKSNPRVSKKAVNRFTKNKLKKINNA